MDYRESKSLLVPYDSGLNLKTGFESSAHCGGGDFGFIS